MDFKKLFGTNEDKEKNGTFVNVGGDVEVKMKRAGDSNKSYSIAQSLALKPLRRKIIAGTVDPDELRLININIFANHIVTDWKGVVVDGKTVKFSKEKFIEFSIECPEFFKEVFAMANELSNFQDEDEADLIKKPVSSIVTD